MPFRVSCPGCRTPSDLPDAMLGQKVRCKHCQKVFQVAAPPRPKAPRAEEPRVVEPVDEPAGKIQARPDLKPPRPAPRVAPKPAARPPARPRKPRPESPSALWWVLGAVAAVLLFGGGVGLAFPLA